MVRLGRALGAQLPAVEVWAALDGVDAVAVAELELESDELVSLNELPPVELLDESVVVAAELLSVEVADELSVLVALELVSETLTVEASVLDTVAALSALSTAVAP